MATSEESLAKLFVGGLPSEATEGDLFEHFSGYGDVAEAVVMRDRSTGVARGFGFVSFADQPAAERALNGGGHVILHRTVEVKRALPRGQRATNDQHLQNHVRDSNGRAPSRNNDAFGADGNRSRSKIFVGGLSSDVTEVELKSFFERFGPIVDGVVMFDSATRRARGFGFITFESEEVTENVLRQSYYELNGKTVEVKRAIPKDSQVGSNNSDDARANPNGHAYTGLEYGGPNGFANYHGFHPSYSRCSPYPSMIHPQAFAGYCMPLGPFPYNSPWTDPRNLCGSDARRGLLPYGGPYMYPSYYTGFAAPYVSMSNGDYRGSREAAGAKQSHIGGGFRAPASNGVEMSAAEVASGDDQQEF